MMDSEDELASVLGHEIEHIDQYHCAERVQVEQAVRKLPLGGAVPQDYEFDEIAVDANGGEHMRKVKMSELFQRDASLAVYSYMYGPMMAKPCPMCTSIMTAASMRPEGFATFCPARRGAEP